MVELPGDEMFGLPAAFLEAGSRAVLAPAWPADDECTASIMIGFHRRLAAGQAPDLALQAAQCEFLDGASSIRRHAYFWSGLFLLSLGRLTGSDATHLEEGERRCRS